MDLLAASVRFRTREIPVNVNVESDSPEVNAIDALPVITVSLIASLADAILPEFPIRAVDPLVNVKPTSKGKDAIVAGPDSSIYVKKIRKDVPVVSVSIVPVVVLRQIWASLKSAAKTVGW